MHSITRRDVLQFALAAGAGTLAPQHLIAAVDPPMSDARDSQFRRGFVDLPSGVRMRFTEIGDADKPVILCLHGYTDSAHSFRMIMPLLAQTHRVIAVDLRGHGETTTPAVGFTIDDFAHDVASFMVTVGIARATIVGHSMGTFIARRVAADHPDHVERLVLIGAGLTADTDIVRAFRDEVHSKGEDIPLAFIEGFQTSTVLDARTVPQWFMDGCIEASRRLQPLVWRETISGLIEDSQTMRDVAFKRATLIVGGERDSLFSVAEQRRLAEAISGSELLLYRHCGHSPNWEQPLRVAEDVQKFLSR